VELVGDEVVLPKGVRIVSARPRGGALRPRAAKEAGPGVRKLVIAPGSEEAYSPQVALRRSVAALGNNAVADLLGVSKSQPGRWARGAEGMTQVNATAAIELDAFIGRMLQTFTRQQAALWLIGSDPQLGGARPVDAFRLKGLSAVLPALAAHEQGASA